MTEMGPEVTASRHDARRVRGRRILVSGVAVAAAIVCWVVFSSFGANTTQRETRQAAVKIGLADSYMYRRVFLPRVFDRLLRLTGGRQYVFVTTHLSAGANPVLHLLSAYGSELSTAGGTGPGIPARLSFIPQTTGNYRVVMRAANGAGSGTTDLTISMSGAPWVRFPHAPIGGTIVNLPNLRKYEVFETVNVPNGSTWTHLGYRLSGSHIVARLNGHGTAGGVSDIAITPASWTVLLGVPTNGRPGWATLLRNDYQIPGHDPDHDGLGTDLERAVGTCSRSWDYAYSQADHATFDCRKAKDMRDTDGDGIRDSWEVLGRRNLQPNQPLPAWGANPRHKDLFVEVDYMQRAGSPAVVHMSPAVIRKFASYYGDTIGPLTPAKAHAHAVTLNNPDGRPGIAVHADTGVAPTQASDATIYGDWGGFSLVPPRADGTGVPAADAWRDWMRPVRRGIFRYVLAYSSGGGSQGYGFAAAFPANDAWVAAHEFGHTFGLLHSGPPGAPADVNCKPNYRSLMNYAFQSEPDVGFSDGTAQPTLNNAALRESSAVSPSDNAMFDVLENQFGYYVDRATGNVDWDRNGVFAPAGATIRAYANYAPGGGGCEYTRYNRTVPTTTRSSLSPALARLGNRVFAFYADGAGVIRYSSSTSSFYCPAPVAEGCAGASWSTAAAAASPLRTSNGFDAVALGGRHQILVVAVDSAGRLMQSRFNLPTSGNPSWTTPAPVPNSTLATGEPSLLARSGCDGLLAYKGTNLQVRYRPFYCDGSWGQEIVARTTAGSTLSTTASASPAIQSAYLPPFSSPQVYGAFTAPSGQLRLYRLTTSQTWEGTRWEDTNLLTNPPQQVVGRPSMAWAPTYRSSDLPGRFYLMYMRPGEGLQRQLRMQMSYVKVTRVGGVLTKTPAIGLDGPFDNVWLGAWGLDLMDERLSDTNLRALLVLESSPSNSANHTLQFRPKADGIQDFSYGDFDDWSTFGQQLCRLASNPGGLVANPVSCP